MTACRSQWWLQKLVAVANFTGGTCTLLPLPHIACGFVGVGGREMCVWKGNCLGGAGPLTTLCMVHRLPKVEATMGTFRACSWNSPPYGTAWAWSPGTQHRLCHRVQGQPNPVQRHAPSGMTALLLLSPRVLASHTRAMPQAAPGPASKCPSSHQARPLPRRQNLAWSNAQPLHVVPGLWVTGRVAQSCPKTHAPGPGQVVLGPWRLGSCCTMRRLCQ